MSIRPLGLTARLTWPGSEESNLNLVVQRLEDSGYKCGGKKFEENRMSIFGDLTLLNLFMCCVLGNLKTFNPNMIELFALGKSGL